MDVLVRRYKILVLAAIEVGGSDWAALDDLEDLAKAMDDKSMSRKEIRAALTLMEETLIEVNGEIILKR